MSCADHRLMPLIFSRCEIDSDGLLDVHPRHSQTSQVRECISCFEDFPRKQLVRLRCHNYCRPCFCRLIAHAIENEAQWPPKCCLKPVDGKQCVKNISGSLKQRYRQKRLEYSTPIELRYYCSFPDCGVFVPAFGADRVRRQVKCFRGHLTCIDCRQQAHETAGQCTKTREIRLVQKLAREEGWRRCYRCHAIVEHADACRHITCRCGAEFCYVCGKVWWTCRCTEDQLDQIKKRVRENADRRRAQEDRERREAEDLKQALEAITTMEAAQAEKLDRIRAAKEAQRKTQVQQTYAELRIKMDEINEFQRGFLDGQHAQDREHLKLSADAAMYGLKLKHDTRLSFLCTSWSGEIDKTQRESIYERQQTIRKGEGYTPNPMEDLNHTQQEQYDIQVLEQGQELEQTICRRDDETERLQWLLSEEIATELELMDAKMVRIKESFGRQQGELQVKVTSERHWLDLTFEERSRLLEEFQAVEIADEMIDEADSRWNEFSVKEEAETGHLIESQNEMLRASCSKSAISVDEEAGSSSLSHAARFNGTIGLSWETASTPHAPHTEYDGSLLPAAVQADAPEQSSFGKPLGTKTSPCRQSCDSQSFTTSLEQEVPQHELYACAKSKRHRVAANMTSSPVPWT